MHTAATILAVDSQGARPNFHAVGATILLEIDDARKECIVNSRFVHWGGVGTMLNLDGGAGAEGSLLVDATRRVRIPAFTVDAYDTTGCGDAYCAGFIAALARGAGVEDACRFASATAALVATGLGSDAGVMDFAKTEEAMNTVPALDA